jgi:hypothetical protein
VQREPDTAPFRPSQPHITTTVTGADGASALPKGFFDDKKSDAIAQGEKPRTAADAEKDLQAFQREVEQLEEKQMAVAAEEADEAAERAAAQEAFEDKYETRATMLLYSPWCLYMQVMYTWTPVPPSEVDSECTSCPSCTILL